MSGVDMRWEPLTRALLDFGAAPGRYAMRLGEPRELHAQLDTVALWAMGRTPELLQAQADALQAAAIAFVQRACFAPDNTHYQVLGLQPGAWSAEQLRTRYRALIRLTHPDMGIQGFPHNAAGMVNRAQEVLSDPRLRSQYDDKLAQAALPVWKKPASVGAPRATRPQSDWLHSGGRWQALNARYPVQLRVAMLAFSVTVLLAGLLTCAAQDSNENRMLIVARAPQPKAQAALQKLPAPRAAEYPTEASESPVAYASVDVASFVPQPQPQAVSPKPAAAAAGVVAAATAPAPAAYDAKAQIPLVAATKTERFLTTQPPVAAPAAAQASAARMPEAVPVPTSAPPAPAPVRVASAPLSPPSPAPVPAVVPAPARVAPAPTPAPLPAPSAPPAAAPEPESPSLAQAAEPVWSVDTPQARHYLTDLVMVLERPQDALRTQNHLTKMNVKGNLLGPSLRLLQQYPQVKVDRISLSDNERPGRVNIQGSVVVQASNPLNDQFRTVKYHVTADFLGTREGTALAHLHIKETD